MEDDNFMYEVFGSSLRLLTEVGVLKHHLHPYTKPYCDYVMSWCHSLPVKNIVMGQNPYP